MTDHGFEIPKLHEAGKVRKEDLPDLPVEGIPVHRVSFTNSLIVEAPFIVVNLDGIVFWLGDPRLPDSRVLLDLNAGIRQAWGDKPGRFLIGVGVKDSALVPDKDTMIDMIYRWHGCWYEITSDGYALDPGFIASGDPLNPTFEPAPIWDSTPVHDT